MARKKIVSIASVAIFALLVILSGMFPAENLFYTFNTPEAVFSYTKTGTIESVIYGEKSCMIIYSSGKNVFSTYVIPKSDTGYKIPNYFEREEISKKIDKNGIFKVEKVKNTNDYYIFCDIDEIKNIEAVELFNENNQKIECDIVTAGDSDFRYFYVNGFTDKHYLVIDGKQYKISGE